jgi:nucleotide-binding universal stress UspA family protein
VIVQLAGDIEADLIVVGNHDRQGINSIFGSVAETFDLGA